MTPYIYYYLYSYLFMTGVYQYCWWSSVKSLSKHCVIHSMIGMHNMSNIPIAISTIFSIRLSAGGTSSASVLTVDASTPELCIVMMSTYFINNYYLYYSRYVTRPTINLLHNN